MTWIGAESGSGSGAGTGSGAVAGRPWLCDPAAGPGGRMTRGRQFGIGSPRAVATAIILGLTAASAARAIPTQPSPSAALAAAGVPLEAEIRAVIAAHDLRRSAQMIDTLVEARLPAQPGAPDPVLDRLIAEFMMNSDQPTMARPYLARAIVAARGAEAAHLTLLMASAEQATGAFAEAEQHYRAVAANGEAAAADRKVATLSLASLLAADRPAETITLLAPLRSGASSDWEAELIASRAYRVGGDPANARTALDRAWQAAPTANAASMAMPRVLNDRSFDAGLAGARDQFNALQAVLRSNREPTEGLATLRYSLPLCGTAGIGPADRVTVEIVSEPDPGRPAASVLWASRPGIARPFLDAIARTRGVGAGGGGQIVAVTLACMAMPSDDFGVIHGSDTAYQDWMTARGVYPPLGFDVADLAALEQRLAAREARYGAESPMLVPLLLVLIARSGAGDEQPDAGKLATVAEYARRADAIVAKNGGPGDLRLVSGLGVLGAEASIETADKAGIEARANTLFDAALADRTVSFDIVYQAVAMASRNAYFTDGFKTDLLYRALAALSPRAPKGDRRIQALTLRLLDMRRDAGDAAGVAKLVAKLALPVDLCALATPARHFLSVDIRPDDYPKDLIRSNMAGNDTIEFDLDAEGQARNPRLLIADPPFAFDAITIERALTLRYDPSSAKGAAGTCRAMRQNVRWQLPAHYRPGDD